MSRPWSRALPAFALALVAGLSVPAPVPAQAPPPDQPDLTVDARIRGETIEALATALEKEYVFPEAAAKMADDLRKRREAKEYDGITGAKEFARTLTEH